MVTTCIGEIEGWGLIDFFLYYPNGTLWKIINLLKSFVNEAFYRFILNDLLKTCANHIF